ncbi:MAG: type II secretion system protein GspM [Gammaproteobacteria bacterium]
MASCCRSTVRCRRRRTRIGQKQADLVWMQSVGPELASSGPAVAKPSTPESLLVVVDRAAREAGLGNSLTNSEPGGPGRLRVRLEKAQFDIMIGWLARLAEQNGIGVESASVDNAGGPGPRQRGDSCFRLNEAHAADHDPGDPRFRHHPARAPASGRG